MSRNTTSGSSSSEAASASGPLARLADDLDVLGLVELEAQLFTGELLVVHDQHPQAAAEGRGAAHAVIRASVCSSGTSIRARVPLPGSLKSDSWYAAP